MRRWADSLYRKGGPAILLTVLVTITERVRTVFASGLPIACVALENGTRQKHNIRK